MRRLKDDTHQTDCLLPGLVFCADCGSRMAYEAHYYKSGEIYHSFRCGKYSTDTSSCTVHYISEKTLHQIVLRSIQRISNRVIADEQAFAKELRIAYAEIFCGANGT